MTRVLTVPEHVQDVGLTAVAQLLHVVLLAGERHDVVGGSQHEGGLKVSHDLLPDGSLHGEMSLDVFDILLSQCLTAPPLLQSLVDHLLAPPLLLVLLPLLLLEIVITGAHGHGAVCLRLLKTRTSRHAICLTLTSRYSMNPRHFPILRLGLNFEYFKNFPIIVSALFLEVIAFRL